MTNEAIEGNEPDSPPNAGRRQLNVAVLAALAGGLGLATTAQAFPRSAKGQFNAASRILAPYGVVVGGDDAGGHDRMDFEIAPLENTEYTQAVGARNLAGEIEPYWMTSVHGDHAVATHFHPGEIIPCIKTTIEDSTRATHELFDAEQGGIVPSFTVESEMRKGGHLGDITATHFHTRSSGEIVPCVKTRIGNDNSLATHEVFDATEGDIIPCIRVETVMDEDGALGNVRIDLDPLLEKVTVFVGTKPYVLRGGVLVGPDAAS